MPARIWLALAALDGLMAVAAGAFAAHGVSDPDAKALLRTGAEYQALHAIAALACFGAFPGAGWAPVLASALFAVGGLVFGGSLYILAFSGAKLWGAVTPVGGVLMLAGWAVLIWAALAGGLGRT